MDNPDNRRPVWNPGAAGPSQNQFIQCAAAESSTSVSNSSSRAYPALAAAANSYPADTYQQRSLQGSSSMQSHYQVMFDMPGSHSQTYQPAQSSYSQESAVDHRDMPSGSDEAGYPTLRVNEDIVRVHGQPVGSSTVSQSGYQQVEHMIIDNSNHLIVPPRVASPVDSTVSQSAVAMTREPALTDAPGSRLITPSRTMPSSNHFAPVQASLASCTQSEVSTSGGSPPDDDIPQDQADLELNQVHGEAEPQNRHTSHLMRDVDMDEAVSSISDQGQMPERSRLPSKSIHPAADETTVMAGEPDTTQEDEEEDLEHDGYPQNSSSIDEAEAVQSTEIPGPSRQLSIPGPSSSLPSTSNAVDSVMEHQQLASMQLAPNARMTSLTASLFNAGQSFRPSPSAGIPLPHSMIQSPSHMIPPIANELIPTQLSASQVVSSSSSATTFSTANQLAPNITASAFTANRLPPALTSSIFTTNQVTPVMTSSTFTASQLASTMTSRGDSTVKYEESEQDTMVVDSSEMEENLCNGVVPSVPEYGASSSGSNIVDDGQQPGTSKQSPKKVRKSIRIKEMEDDKPYWHREPYQIRPYDPDKLWCDVCQVAYDEECPTHRLTAIADKIVFSRAWSSLPPSLQIFRLLESVELGVFAKRPLPKFTQFGPFVGELVDREVVLTNSDMPILVERDGEVLYFDTSDENKCNWMMFVRFASSFAEQNLVLYQHGQEIYFTVTKPIEQKSELKVWYANNYADRHGLNRLEVTEQDIDTLQEAEFKFHCYECSKKFRTAVALQKHLFEHDEETGSSKVESTWDSLLEHERKALKKPGARVSHFRKKLLAARKIRVEPSSESAASPLYHWKKRSTNIYLNKTLKKYHKRQGADARKTIQSMYRKTGKEAGGDEWTCNSCCLVFDNPNLLNLHTLTHAAENVGLEEVTKLSYQINFNDGQTETGDGQSTVSTMEVSSQGAHTLACPVCSAQFTEMMALVQHAAEHGKTKTPKFPNFHRPYKCDQCWKAFTTQERLTQHFFCHGPEESKPFQCRMCGKRFMNNSALSCHLKTHSVLKYYECPLCHLGFDQSSAMREHSLIHISPEGLYNCLHCDKKFSEFLVLKKHIRGFHTSKYYPCEQCEKVFPREDKLRLHMLCHSSVREFMCETCGKQFKRKDKLKEHIKRLHSVERQVKDLEKSLRPPRVKFIPKVSPTDYQRFIYKCHICLLGFKRRGMLVNHLANKHPGIKPDTVPELNLPILKTQRDYYCQYCEKVYKSSSKRKAHILKNHPGAELPLSARKKLPVEEAVEGIDNPTYSQTVGSITTMPHGCEHCHKQYASKAKLVQHQRKKHIGLVPPAPERSKRDKIDIGQMQQQEGATSVIHVVEAYDADGQAAETVAGADLLTQAMSELTQSIQEYRQNTPGAPDLYQVSARLGAGPPTMVQIQTGNSNGSTIELTHLTQALQHFSPGQGPIQISVSGTSQPIQIPIVTQALQTFSPSHIQVSVPGTSQPIQIPIVTRAAPSGEDQGDGQGVKSEATAVVTSQAVSYQPLNLVSGTAYIPKAWTNYTYK